MIEILHGLVIFAKNEYIQESLVKQMKTHSFKKEYIAVLEGIVEPEKGTIDAPIARKESSIIERCIDPNGDVSITHYEVLKYIKHNLSLRIENARDKKKANNISIVKFILETGRTHQIRIHSKYIGYPIVGDTLYGSESNLISRQALHSYKINFIHPVIKEPKEYIAPIPEDMKFIQAF